MAVRDVGSGAWGQCWLTGHPTHAGQRLPPLSQLLSPSGGENDSKSMDLVQVEALDSLLSPPVSPAGVSKSWLRGCSCVHSCTYWKLKRLHSMGV